MIKYFATAQLGDVSMSIENEVGTIAEALAQVAEVSRHINNRTLPNAPAQVAERAAKLQAEMTAKLVDSSMLKSLSEPVPALDPKTADVPTVDAVADAVKLVVGKHGVPRAAALLKEHGGRQAKDVPAENRAAFIEAAQKAVSV